MHVSEVLTACMNCIVVFRSAMNTGTILQEFEVLAYEQACRTYESIMRNVREQTEGLDDEPGENP